MNNSENTTSGIEIPEVDMQQLEIEAIKVQAEIHSIEKVLRSLKLKLAVFEFVKKYSPVFSTRPESEENDKQ